MTEENTTAQQVTTPVQPASPPTPTTPAVDYEARYKGMVKKVEELTLSLREKDGQLAEKSSEIERLTSELTMKDTEKTVAVGERDKQLNDLVTSKSQLETELAELRALKAKVEVANELGNPSLLAIVDTIPSVQDKEVLKTLMSNISAWGNQQVKAREEQLLAGTTPDVAATAPAPTQLPTNSEEWQAFVNQAELGTPERQQRMDAWRDWGLGLSRQ